MYKLHFQKQIRMNKELTILYVDDEKINLRLFEINFKRKCNVITAESGLEGLAVLDEHNGISVVISDMSMPGISGIEFIKRAKAKYSELSYYVLTGFDISEEIEQALAEGLILKNFRKPMKMKEIEKEIMSNFLVK